MFLRQEQLLTSHHYATPNLLLPVVSIVLYNLETISSRTNQQRGFSSPLLTMETGIAVAGAAASLSMADVDMTQVGKQQNSNKNALCVGSLTYLGILATSK